MKKRDLEQKLKELGWYFRREGAEHEVWTNGTLTVVVPRHREIVEMTAKKIIKFAENNSPAQETEK